MRERGRADTRAPRVAAGAGYAAVMATFVRELDRDKDRRAEGDSALYLAKMLR